jgi:hypothetical protein
MIHTQGDMKGRKNGALIPGPPSRPFSLTLLMLGGILGEV